MLKLVRDKSNVKDKAMSSTATTATAPSKLTIAEQELLAAREKREATRAEGLACEKLLHTLEHGDAPEIWTSESFATRQADVLNTKRRLADLKDQLAADNIAVDLADKKLERLQTQAQQWPKRLENRRYNLTHVHGADVRRCEQALDRAQTNLTEARKVLAQKQDELSECEREYETLTGKAAR
jgi:chromosome segregation ATPase